MRYPISILAAASIACCGVAVADAHAPRASSAAATKAKLQVRTGKLGHFIVDAKGLTLYEFEKDKHGKSACSGACAKVWAPYLTTGDATAGSGLIARKVGTTKRSDGTTQVMYNGHPLYHYDDDHKPGQTEGQGSKQFGAEWYVLTPLGKKIDSD